MLSQLHEVLGGKLRLLQQEEEDSGGAHEPAVWPFDRDSQRTPHDPRWQQQLDIDPAFDIPDVRGLC